MLKKIINDCDFNGKIALVRVDFNVPIEEKKIMDDKRIKMSLPTINYLLENGASVVLMSHLGRPSGKYVEELSLEPIAKRLEELLNREVKFIKDPQVVSDETIKKVRNIKQGEIVLLENTRFRSEEKENDEEFAKKLSELGDIYVNDAFGTAHRAHASNVGVSKYLESCVGFLIRDEIEYFANTLENPKRPFIAIIGGKKISGKIDVIESLMEKVDKLIVVGGMAYTFLKSKGLEIGESIVEDDKLDLARNIMVKAIENHVELYLPEDILITKQIDQNAETKYVDVEDIPRDWMGVDIGPKTIEKIQDLLKDSRTVVWNGPAGIFEISKFAKGTNQIARTLADLKEATTIIGGGDSARAIESCGVSDKITHISTGGGASLELLEGKDLPGIVCIDDKEEE